jgi:hypothetical protein
MSINISLDGIDGYKNPETLSEGLPLTVRGRSVFEGLIKTVRQFADEWIAVP